MNLEIRNYTIDNGISHQEWINKFKKLLNSLTDLFLKKIESSYSTQQPLVVNHFFSAFEELKNCTETAKKLNISIGIEILKPFINSEKQFVH